MESPTTNQLKIREYPWIGWLAAIFALALSFWFWRGGASWFIILGLLAGGLIFLALAAVTTISADRTEGVLKLSYRSLVRHSQREWSFQQIQAVEVETSPGDSDNGPTHRVVFVLRSGERVPLHGYFSGGYQAKARKAERISMVIGSQGPAARYDPPAQADRAALTPVFQILKAGTTNEIVWRLESGRRGSGEALPSGAVPASARVTRWFSTSYCFPAGFVLLAQIPPNSLNFEFGSWLQGISNQLWKVLLAIYGFEEQDTPGIQWARALKLDQPLAGCFQALTSAPEDAQLVLGPWAARSLTAWAQQHPVHKLHNPGTISEQLAVLLCPRGVYLAILGNLDEVEQDALIETGLSLVRQLGSSQ